LDNVSEYSILAAPTELRAIYAYPFLQTGCSYGAI